LRRSSIHSETTKTSGTTASAVIGRMTNTIANATIGPNARRSAT
jgi:hypothetical protein